MWRMNLGSAPLPRTEARNSQSSQCGQDCDSLVTAPTGMCTSPSPIASSPELVLAHALRMVWTSSSVEAMMDAWTAVAGVEEGHERHESSNLSHDPFAMACPLWIVTEDLSHHGPRIRSGSSKDGSSERDMWGSGISSCSRPPAPSLSTADSLSLPMTLPVFTLL